MSKQLPYTDDSIKSLDIINHIKKRPSAYIEDTSVQGQFKLIKEGLDNALDEVENLSHFSNNLLQVYTTYDPDDLSCYMVTIIDNGRGIPAAKLKDIYTKGYTSGKFDTESYITSGGLLGIGAKVIYALSDSFKAITLHNNKLSILHKTSEIEYFDNLSKKSSALYQRLIKGTSGVILQFVISKKYFTDINIWLNSGIELLRNLLLKISLFKQNKFNIIYGTYHLKTGEILYNIDTQFYGIKDLSVKHLESAKSDKLFNSTIFQNNPLFYYNVLLESIAPDIPLSNDDFETISKASTKYDITFSSNKNLKHVAISLISIQPEHKKFRPLLSKLRNSKIALVNNLVIENDTSYHISIFTTLLKTQLSNLIEDQDIKEYLISPNYKFPFVSTFDIQFSGAQFVGTTKHAFRDVIFKEEYLTALTNYFTTNPELITNLLALLSEDIVNQYNIFYNKSFINKSNKNLFTQLNRPTKFMDCLTTDRKEAELFLFEGDSAKSSVGRDSHTQALYSLSGKVLNALTVSNDSKKCLKQLTNNAIFSDVIKLLNIPPNSKDLSTLNFDKIFILSDADTHGYHIASVIIGNLYVYNKHFIEQGHLYLVIPPLYSIRFKNTNKAIYIRSKAEFVYTFCKFVFYDMFDIILTIENTPHTLPFEAYVVFMELLYELGEEFENLGNELEIPSVLAEVIICHKSIFMKKTFSTKDIAYLKSITGLDIHYDKKDNLLIFSMMYTDYIIPCYKLEEILSERLENLLQKLNYFNIILSIKYKHTNNQNQLSIVQLYEHCKSFESLCKIDRFKGVGSMNSIDREKSCMDKSTRMIYQISSIGNLDLIYGSLGKASDFRKENMRIK